MDSNTPRATYRVQLCRDFGFRDAARHVPYLAALGISTLYCSPVLQARSGSTHGYDTTDATRLSEELGGEKDWKELCVSARKHGLSILLDIVPNHMAASIENPWWRSVLEYGRLSPYATFFDIDWSPPEPWLRNRVLLPVLTTRLPDAIVEGHLKVGLSSRGLVLRYRELELPLDVRSCRVIMESAAHLSPDASRASTLSSFARTLEHLRPVPITLRDDSTAQYRKRVDLTEEMLRLLNVDANASLVKAASEALTAAHLRRLLKEQSYALQWWQDARAHINYRRFFDINDLVGVRVEDQQVFCATHRKLAHLAGDPVVCGFRVDHIDGLLDPVQYLEQLRTMSRGEDSYLVVEKILTGDEVLPHDWPVEGTTGYEFLTAVNGLFVNAPGLAMIERHYRCATRTRSTRARLTLRNKRSVIRSLFRSEITRLLRGMEQAAVSLPSGPLPDTRLLRAALEEATARLPVYRTYFRQGKELSPQDKERLSRTFESQGTAARAAEDIVRQVLTPRTSGTTEYEADSPAERLMCRWQQVTGAVMAKGFEDTTLYQDTTLLSLNDVGSRPDHSVSTIADFHKWNQIRLRDWPFTLNCTATHDTKRGEDVRARLSALSEMPEDWLSLAKRWLDYTASVCPEVDAATALLLLQTLVGTWSGDDSADAIEFTERVKRYLVKAAREAKTHSNWLTPDEIYEGSLQQLAATVLAEPSSGGLRDDIARTARTVAFHGGVNSLAQTTLKAMCPGVPDFFQGTELWELCMVDPDNRRPVDYALRGQLLNDMTKAMNHNRLSFLDELTAHWPDARAKLLAMHVALQLRKEHSELFEKGDYVPIEAEGKARNHVVSFARTLGQASVLIVAPVQTMEMTGAARLPLGREIWGTKSLRLPEGLHQAYEDAFTGTSVMAKAGRLPLADVFARFPVSILVSRSM